MRVSIIIPVFNERVNIANLISKVKLVKIPAEKEIIVVDDCSNDGTIEILNGIQGIKLFFHKKNVGKGGALKTGIRNSAGDIIIIQDADLEYSPDDYNDLIQPIIREKTKVVYGSRILKKNKQGNFYYFFGGKMVTFFTNLLYNSKLTDEPTCYKIFHKDIRNILINAEANGFEWEPEVTAKILRKGYKILEIPISYFPRSKKEGKKIKLRDGFIAIKTLFKWKFKKI